MSGRLLGQVNVNGKECRVLCNSGKLMLMAKSVEYYAILTANPWFTWAYVANLWIKCTNIFHVTIDMIGVDNIWDRGSCKMENQDIGATMMASICWNIWKK